MTTPITVTGTVTDPLGATDTDTATVSVDAGQSGARTLRKGLMTDRVTVGGLPYPDLPLTPGTDSNPREYGVQFTVAWAVQLEVVRIYKHPDAAGSIPVTLWNATTQAVIASTTVTWTAGADTRGWVEIPLTAALSTGTQYAVSFFAANAKYYEIGWRYHAQDYVEPPFEVPMFNENTVPSSGGSVYNSTGHGFPAQHYAHYWMVDPIVSWTTTYPGYTEGTAYYDQWANGKLSHGFPIGVFYPDPPWLEDYMSVGINLAVAPPIQDGYRNAVAASGIDVYAAVVYDTDAPRYVLSDPAVFGQRVKGYFLSDEPDMVGTGELPLTLRERLQTVRAIDSTRPIVLNLGMFPALGQAYTWYPIGATPQQVAANWSEYAALSDILSCDWYNIANTQGRYGIWTYAPIVRRMQSLARENTPVWGYVETVSLGGGRNVTPEEVRSGVWACLIAGATGIVYFDHQFASGAVSQDFAYLLNHADMRTMITAINAQIQSLAGPLLKADAGLLTDVETSNTTAGPYGGVFGVPFEATTRVVGSTQYLFAMSARPGATTGRFTVPTAAGVTVTVIGESRTIDVDVDGVIEDDFATDYTVHLYTWTGIPPDTTPPSTPTGLVASAITASGVTITWDAATDDIGVVGYQARLDGTTVVDETGLSHTFTGLEASTAYSADVRARDAAGNWSAWSTALLVTTGEAGTPLPVAAWGFSEVSGTVAADSIGAADLTLTTAAMLGNTGHTGTGLRQAGASSSASVPSSFVTGNTARTIMCWARRGNTGGGFIRGPLLQIGGVGGGGVFGIFLASPAPGVQFRARPAADIDTPLPPVGEWHHYAITASGGVARAYIDGVQFGSDVTIGGTLEAGHTALVIFDSDGDAAWDVDDVRVFTVGLTGAQIVEYRDTPV